MVEGYASYRFCDFGVGDRVRHIGMKQVGTVVSITETVNVKYDHIGARGRHWAGEYPPSWFETVGLLAKE